MLEVKRKPIVRRKRVLMSDDLRTDHVKLQSPSVLTKKFFFARPLGRAPAPLVYASAYTTVDCRPV